MHVSILAFDGFEELDAIGPFEVFGVAADEDPAVRVDLVALDGAATVTGAHGLVIEPAVPASAEDATVVVIPGGGWLDPDRAVRREIARETLLPFVRERHAAGTILAGVCTGTMAIAAAGLIDGRPAITHHRAVDALEAAGAVVTEARIVDDGDIVTAGGVSAGIDLALWLLERGEPLAASVAATMEYDPRGRIAG